MPIQTLSPKATQELMAQGAQLIDIRSADEHAREHIAEARHIPLDQFPPSGSLPVSASVVIFHCRSGQRTRMNASKLEASCGGLPPAADPGSDGVQPHG